MADNIAFLNALQTISEKAKESEEFLKMLIDTDLLPPEVKAQFMQAQAALNTQDLVIRKLTQHQLENEDNLNRIQEKLEKLL